MVDEGNNPIHQWDVCGGYTIYSFESLKKQKTSPDIWLGKWLAVGSCWLSW